MRFPRAWGPLADYARLPILLPAGCIVLSRLFSSSQHSKASVAIVNENRPLNLTQAIDKNPGDPDLYYQRACLYFQERKFDLSEKDVDSVIKLSKDTVASNAWLLKSKIYTVRGDWSTSRRVLKEDPGRFGELGAQVSQQLSIIDRLEEHLQAAKFAESARDFRRCHRFTGNLVNRAPHSRAVLTLHASCALELLNMKETQATLAGLTELSNATVEDFLTAARFAYFFAETSGSKSSMGLLRNCLNRFPKNTRCLSLVRQIKKFNSSFVGIAEMLESGDWKGLVSSLVHSGTNTTASSPLLPTFDAELSRSRPTATFDVKPLSKRRVLLARTLCTSAENLGLDTVKLNIWCGRLGHKLSLGQPAARPSVV